jgi:hypothetical protein
MLLGHRFNFMSLATQCHHAKNSETTSDPIGYGQKLVQDNAPFHANYRDIEFQLRLESVF